MNSEGDSTYTAVTWDNFLFNITDATVSLIEAQSAVEGNPIEVCVEISDVPDGGLECNITVELNTVSGEAGTLLL